MAPFQTLEVLRLPGPDPRRVFARARTLWSWGQPVKAIPLFEELIHTHPRNPLAELSVSLLLDSLLSLGRREEARIWLERVREDRDLMRGRPELRANLADFGRRIGDAHAKCAA